MPRLPVYGALSPPQSVRIPACVRPATGPHYLALLSGLNVGGPRFNPLHCQVWPPRVPRILSLSHVVTASAAEFMTGLDTPIDGEIFKMSTARAAPPAYRKAKVSLVSERS